MSTLKPKRTNAEKAAIKIMAGLGGKAVSKKRGPEYMSRIGKRGAKKRWEKVASKKTK